jgi:hypothetical protein
MNTSASAAAETLEMGADGTFKQKRHGCGAKTKRKWSAVELAVMIGGFVVFWPVGLVALGVKLINGEMWKGSSEAVSPWTAYRN